VISDAALRERLERAEKLYLLGDLDEGAFREER